MKISPRDLPYHLKKQTTKQPVFIYWIFGEEPFQKQEAAGQILSFLKTQHPEAEILSTQVDKTFDSLFFFQNTTTPSLFSSIKIIKIYLDDPWPTQFGELLAKHITRSSETYFLIMGPKIPMPKQQETWFKNLDPNTCFIPIWPIDAQQLPRWITQQAHKFGLKLHPTAAHYLSESTEGNLLATYQTLEKLAYSGLSEIKLSDLEAIQTDVANFDLQQLAEAFLLKDTARAIRIFNSLLAQKIEPILILWSLTQEIRILIKLHHELESAPISNKTYISPTVFKKYKIYEKKQPIFSTALSHFSETDCQKILIQLAHTDRQIKGVETGEPKETLLTLILKN